MNKQQRFYELYKKWKNDTMFLSSSGTDHESFLEIVAMGIDIIPLLLANLWDSWLPIDALHQILGELPFEIMPEDEGRFDNLNKKWYNWGEYNGYI